MERNPESKTAFTNALGDAAPPSHWNLSFQALWWDANGNWQESHAIAQDLETFWGNWLHAYLHRKEGDIWNARYWYGQAGISESNQTLEEEFICLLEALFTPQAG